MKARKKGSNDEWKNIAYVQLRDSYYLTSADQMEFQHDNLKTYNQADEEKHWQDVRDIINIMIIDAVMSSGELVLFNFIEGKPEKYLARFASKLSDKLVKLLKGE